MIETSANVIIFEGPDGAGKTFAAKRLAEATGSMYVHSGPFKRVTTGLGRLYVEAMLPALLGGRSVILDRAWMSEPIYGEIYRSSSRLTPADLRMLDRLAWRCGAVVVNCRPTPDVVVRNFESRRAEEMLDDVGQLKAIYDRYADMPTSLNVVEYNYTNMSLDMLLRDIGQLMPPAHPLAMRSAGNFFAKVTLVGEAFGEVKNQDPAYQWPFASFSSEGCSRWLTDQLEAAGIGEDQLSWVNADQDLTGLAPAMFNQPAHLIKAGGVIALGQKASATLAALGITHRMAAHPSYWSRYHASEPYPLIPAIRELLGTENLS